jgi:hypothetical protein
MSEYSERKIIIDLITSTEFHTQLASEIDVTLFESNTAKRIASWAVEYFVKYNKAPGKDIEPIFWKKVKAGLPKELAEEIEQDILPGLSEEFENNDPSSVNIEYMVDEARQYFNERRILRHNSEVATLISQNKILEAERKILTFKPLENSIVKVTNHILSVDEIRGKKTPKPPVLFSPWLRRGQTTIVYAGAGVGKTLFTLAVAYCLGLKNYDDDNAEIGKWQVKRPTGTLYIDGEMGEQEMEERVKQFEWLGMQNPKHKLKILSIPEYQFATQDTFTLSLRENQLKIIQWLKDNPSYGLIVLDSASTLFGLVEENDNSEWSNKVNPFLRDLRALNVGCLLLHHSGKDSKRGLRGASAMGAMAHNIFKLSDHPDKDQDLGEAWFILSKDKYRSGGFNFKTFALHFSQNEDQSETHWEVSKF